VTRRKTSATTGEPPGGASQSGTDQLSLADRLLAISHEFALRLPPDVRVIDHGRLLYDEHGLPRTDSADE
jgi:hypothetical protein